MSLNPRQQAFVEYFLGDEEVQWNATRAAEKAGYAHPLTQGPRLLGNVRVQEHIRRRLEEMGASTEELVQRWLARSRVDISPFVTEDGLDVEGLKEAGLGYLIKGVRKTKDATNIELRDPDVAEDRLARHLGMFVHRRELTGRDGGAIEHKNVSDITDAEAARRLLALLADEDLDRLAESARRAQAD